MEAAIRVNSYNRLPTQRKERQIPSWLMPLAYNWKKILLFSIIAALLIGGIAFCDRAGQGQEWRNATGLTGLVLNWLDSIFGASDLEGHIGLLKVTRSSNVLTVGNYTINIMGLLGTVNAIFVNIGTCWLLVLWGASFFDMLMQNNNQIILEQMIRKFVYLIIGLVLVENAMDIVFGATNFGTAVLETIADASNAAAPNLSDIKQAMYEEMTAGSGLLGFIVNAVTSIGYVLELFIPWVFSLICNLLVSVVCWSRFVEIAITATVSPVMFADVGDDRGGFAHTSAMRAIKQVLALALSGALIYVSLVITSQISASIMADFVLDDTSYLDSCYSMVIINIVRVGLASKASSLSKQLVGLA